MYALYQTNKLKQSSVSVFVFFFLVFVFAPGPVTIFRDADVFQTAGEIG